MQCPDEALVETGAWPGAFVDLDAASDEEAWALGAGGLLRLHRGGALEQREAPPGATRVVVGHDRVAVAGEALWFLDATTGDRMDAWPLVNARVLDLAVEDERTVVVVGVDTAGHPTDRCSFLQRFTSRFGSPGKRTDVRDAFAPPSLPVCRRAGLPRCEAGRIWGPAGEVTLGAPALGLAPTPRGGWVRLTSGVVHLEAARPAT